MSPSIDERLCEIVEPVVSQLGLELYDLEYRSGKVVVTVELAGTASGEIDDESPERGIDLEQLTRANRAISAALDENDPITSRYSLEVSSPGLERQLRTPKHFASAVGQTVTIKMVATFHVRRINGLLIEIYDDAAISVDADGTTYRVALDDIEKARTVFEWGPTPKPGKPDKKVTAS